MELDDRHVRPNSYPDPELGSRLWVQKATLAAEPRGV